MASGEITNMRMLITKHANTPPHVRRVNGNTLTRTCETKLETGHAIGTYAKLKTGHAIVLGALTSGPNTRRIASSLLGCMVLP